jgi:hypothetical protein
MKDGWHSFLFLRWTFAGAKSQPSDTTADWLVEPEKAELNSPGRCCKYGGREDEAAAQTVGWPTAGRPESGPGSWGEAP